MKTSRCKLIYALLLLAFTALNVLGQKAFTAKDLNENEKQHTYVFIAKKDNAAMSCSEAQEQAVKAEGKSLSNEYVRAKKECSFIHDGELTNYFISGLHPFFSESAKKRLETNQRPNQAFSYKKIPAGINGFYYKSERNLPAATVKTLDAGEQPIQEVFQTQLVYPQERGEIQFTFNSRYGKSSRQSLFQTPISIEYGITNNWQVEMEWDVQSRRNEIGEALERGAGDLSFGTQYSFMNMAGSNFHSAVGLEITLPTADVEKELTEGFVEYEPYFIVAKDFPKLSNLQMFSQVGIGFNQRTRGHSDADNDEPAAHEFNAGVGAFVPFRRVVFTGEFNLSTNRWNNGGEEREIYFTPGVVWRLPRHFEMGTGIPVGLTRDAEKFSISFKLVYEFNLFGRDYK